MTHDIDFQKRFARVLGKNYQCSTFDVGRMAVELALSERQLQRRVRRSTGQTPMQALCLYRLSRSRDILESGSAVGKTAAKVGFSSHAYFTRCFKNQFGVVPSSWRPDTRK